MALGSCDSHLTKLLPQHGSQKVRARSHHLTRPARSGKAEDWKILGGSLETSLTREYSPRPSPISIIPIIRKIFQSASQQQLRKDYWQASNKSSAHKALKFSVTLLPEPSNSGPKFPPWPLRLLETQITNPKACRAEQELTSTGLKQRRAGKPQCLLAHPARVVLSPISRGQPPLSCTGWPDLTFYESSNFRGFSGLLLIFENLPGTTPVCKLNTFFGPPVYNPSTTLWS